MTREIEMIGRQIDEETENITIHVLNSVRVLILLYMVCNGAF